MDKQREMMSICCEIAPGVTNWDVVFNGMKKQFIDKIVLSTVENTILTLIVSNEPIAVERLTDK